MRGCFGERRASRSSSSSSTCTSTSTSTAAIPTLPQAAPHPATTQLHHSPRARGIVKPEQAAVIVAVLTIVRHVTAVAKWVDKADGRGDGAVRWEEWAAMDFVNCRHLERAVRGEGTVRRGENGETWRERSAAGGPTVQVDGRGVRRRSTRCRRRGAGCRDVGA